MSARRITLRILPPNPIGEVTMVPEPLSGRPEAHTARAMADAFADSEASPPPDLPAGAVERARGRLIRHHGPLAARVLS